MTDWRTRAACQHARPIYDAAYDLHPTTPAGRDAIRTAVAICVTQCPVIKKCRDMADRIELGPMGSCGERLTYGIWSGERPSERIRRRSGQWYVLPEDREPDAAIGRECPTCRVRPGEPCVDTNGRPARRTHSHRRPLEGDDAA